MARLEVGRQGMRHGILWFPTMLLCLLALAFLLLITTLISPFLCLLNWWQERNAKPFHPEIMR